MHSHYQLVLRAAYMIKDLQGSRSFPWPPHSDPSDWPRKTSQILEQMTTSFLPNVEKFWFPCTRCYINRHCCSQAEPAWALTQLTGKPNPLNVLVTENQPVLMKWLSWYPSIFGFMCFPKKSVFPSQNTFQSFSKAQLKLRVDILVLWPCPCISRAWG